MGPVVGGPSAVISGVLSAGPASFTSGYTGGGGDPGPASSVGYGDDHDAMSVESGETRYRASSPLSKSEKRWKVRVTCCLGSRFLAAPLLAQLHCSFPPPSHPFCLPRVRCWRCVCLRQLTAFEDVNKNFKVVIRVRPPLPRELTGEMGPFQNVVRVDPSERQIIFSENVAALDDDSVVTTPFATHTFTFDHVYDQNCNQRKVYETTAKAVVDSSLQGYNATIFAYGQTVRRSPVSASGGGAPESRPVCPAWVLVCFVKSWCARLVCGR